MDLDWSGQFRTESHVIYNYSLSNGNQTADPSDSSAPVRAGKGYYIPGGGSNSTNFQMLFLKLKPKVIVNDNIYIRSEWWAGDPIYGFFGSTAPYASDQRQHYSTQSRGSKIYAQRLWTDIITDAGTVQLGRAPLHWGLGLVWNSGDDLWSRYPSTGDTLRMSSRFGSFVVTPAIVKYSMGNTIGGACDFSAGSCTPKTGGQAIMDYSLALKYDNLEEDFEGGLNFIRRVGGAQQDATAGYLGGNGVPAAMRYNLWGIYAKKRQGPFLFAGELPVLSGDLGGMSYRTYALALEANWQVNEAIESVLKIGRSPGQDNLSAGSLPNRYRAFYFHPDYHIGLIMFNYQLANFAGVQTQNDPTMTENQLSSPYDNPITNAQYVALGGNYKTGKWRFRTTYLTARANDTASAGKLYYNSWRRSYSTVESPKNQGRSLGWEMDFGSSFHWDDAFQFHFDFGWYRPGEFYRFSDTDQDNALGTVWAFVLKAGINF